MLQQGEAGGAVEAQGGLRGLFAALVAMAAAPSGGVEEAVEAAAVAEAAAGGAAPSSPVAAAVVALHASSSAMAAAEAAAGGSALPPAVAGEAAARMTKAARKAKARKAKAARKAAAQVCVAARACARDGGGSAVQRHRHASPSAPFEGAHLGNGGHGGRERAVCSRRRGVPALFLRSQRRRPFLHTVRHTVLGLLLPG